MLFKCYVSIILLTELSCCSSLLYSIVFHYEDCCQHFHHRNHDGNSNVKFIYQKRFVYKGHTPSYKTQYMNLLSKEPWHISIHCTKEAVLT